MRQIYYNSTYISNTNIISLCLLILLKEIYLATCLFHHGFSYFIIKLIENLSVVLQYSPAIIIIFGSKNYHDEKALAFRGLNSLKIDEQKISRFLPLSACNE